MKSRCCDNVRQLQCYNTSIQLCPWPNRLSNAFHGSGGWSQPRLGS